MNGMQLFSNVLSFKHLTFPSTHIRTITMFFNFYNIFFHKKEVLFKKTTRKICARYARKQKL